MNRLSTIHSMKKLKTAALVGCLAVFATACSDDDDSPRVTGNAACSGNIAEIADCNTNFDTLTAALEAADLVTTLSGSTDFTVFAPTDAAFDELFADLGVTPAQFLARSDLGDILTYHVLQGAVSSTAAITLAGATVNTAETVEGSDLTLTLDGNGSLFVDRSEVVDTDVDADNGVIHVINKVLVPPDTFNNVETAQADGRFDTLVAAVVEADLVDTLVGSDFTIFAPTDDAFETLFTALGVTPAQFLARDDLSSILTYHVLSGAVDSTTAIGLAGDDSTDMQPTVETSEVTLSVTDGNLFVDRSQVIVTDVDVSNGFIHAIDKVLVPPNTFNIVETAQADGRFDTLVAAIVEADLVDALTGTEARTVFAPTDDAFATLIAENDSFSSAADILALSNLSDILLYHVLGSEVDADTAITVAGGTGTTDTLLTDNAVGLSLDSGNLFVNGAQVIITDVETSNGIIHAIDRVLLPASPSTLSDTSLTIAGIVSALAAATDAEFTYLLAALEQEGFDTTLAGAGPFTVFAPTDAAFAAVGTPSEVLALAGLADILEQHVVSGVAIDSVSAYAAAGTSVNTLETSVAVSINESRGLQIDDANVAIADVEASNGVIHVIDAVLTTD